MVPGHGSVQFLQVGGQPVLQDVVDDELRVVVVLLQTRQQEAFAQVREQVPDAGQEGLQLRTAHRTHGSLRGRDQDQDRDQDRDQV